MTTVEDVCRELALTPLAGSSQNREVSGGYCGDLLSWVMGRAQAGQAWITIMQNINVAAVANLADVSMVILAEGASPDDNLLSRARLDDMPLFASDKSAFTLAGELARLL